MSEIEIKIKIVPWRVRFDICASCRSAAVGRVSIDGKLGSTTCARHANLWLRRAREAAKR